MGQWCSWKIISGFIDPNEVDEAPVAATHIGSELSEEELEDEDDDADDDDDDDDDANEGGIDPEFARQKFGELRDQYEKTRAAISKNGRDHAKARIEIDALSDLFKQFRLVPKQFDRLVKDMRDMMQAGHVRPWPTMPAHGLSSKNVFSTDTNTVQKIPVKL